MKILVAIPVYDGHLHAQVVRCLLNEKTMAHLMGDEILVEMLPGCSHPGMGRNQLADTFLKSDCDRLVFLDSDITFGPGSLIKLAHCPVDLVGGCFRFKLGQECYPVGWLEDREELWANALGLLEVASLPGGFLSISRNVFETLKAKSPERVFEHFGNRLHCFFEMPFEMHGETGHLSGEDSFFCRSWRNAGGQVFLDPEIALTHWDFSPTPYPGHIGKWLKARNTKQKDLE